MSEANLHVVADDGKMIRVGHFEGDVLYFDREQLPYLLVSANAALPGGDSRKFTQDDVELLRFVDQHIMRYAGDDRAPGGRLRDLADRIAALLPPEK